MHEVEVTEFSSRSGRVLVLAFGVLVVVMVAYFATGMPGMDHSTTAMDPGGTTDMADMGHDGGGPVALSPQKFADRTQDDEVFVVNVHVPAGASIAGTDATIAFDRLVDDERLPTDLGTPILLYCETALMSGEAASDLFAAGYTDVAHLAGGTDAWRSAGFELERA